MIWCRFYINIKEVNEDYRPVIWPIKYPYWLSGESDEAFIICAYADSEEDIYKQWPEAYDLDSEKVNSIEFSDRFPAPDWWGNEWSIEKNETNIIGKTPITHLDELYDVLQDFEIDTKIALKINGKEIPLKDILYNYENDTLYINYNE